MKAKSKNFVKSAVFSLLLFALVNCVVAQTWTGGPPTAILGGSCTSISGFSGIIPGYAYTGALQVTSPNGYGYIQIGPQNSTWCHIQTGNPYFYFNKPLHISSGIIGAYNSSMYLQTTSGSIGTTRVTISNSTGYVGINTTPAERLDVSGADANGEVSVFRSGNYNAFLSENLAAGADNYLTKINDNGIFWTDGLNGVYNQSSGFIIAPYAQNGFGIRIDGANGYLSVGNGATQFNSGTTWESSSLGYGTSYIGFNTVRSSLGSGNWTTNADGGSLNGGNVIFGDIQGDLRFVNIPNHAGTQPYSDATLFNYTTMMITANGQVVIGSPSQNISTPGSYKLYVSGGILAEQIKVALVNTSGWADYVFGANYKLMPLTEVEAFIKENKHLPDVSSAKDLKDNGMDVVSMDATLLKKIEELTLYMIQLRKVNNDNESKIQMLEEQVKILSEKN